MILSSPAQPGYIPKKIVSLVPSQTELLFDLGLDAAVAGITKFCVHPKVWLKTKTIVGGTKNIHIDQVRNIQPDLVLANKEENTKEQIETLAESFNVWLTDVNNLADALLMIKDIAMLTAKENEANVLCEKITRSFNVLAETLPMGDPQLPTAYLIWQKPYMTVGGDTFIADMLSRCGLKNIFAGLKRYPEMNISQLKSLGCKLLLLSSEPYPFKQKHIDELQLQLPDTKIILVDGEMFSWYGSRLVVAAEYFMQLCNEINGFAYSGDQK